ncbi:DUF2332 domain-containing protein [Dictyobacter formicarum]|uniref:DUF2332 domain-containing protein n=1 Tax=Dictyobacter formicarum TaxID=2778368 RepID=A0ABQ3V8F1_9CHLR|nr:DUF2332 domain-containing protein [Dictyobacter formicarum]GHO82050.1 hypothetical protein KSZ_00560 [Dictyobacter formicarum]
MSQSNHALGLDDLAYHFRRFADRESEADFSPLYAMLARNISMDPDVLRLARLARADQPVPNLLLGAVHYLLLSGVQHPLAAFYPSLTSIPRRSRDLYPAFRAFCQAYDEQIADIISSRIVQTNEVRRCACLLPMFEIVAQLGRARPLAIIEIGSSAGLNLLWDQYGYRYGNTFALGTRTAALQLNCDLLGSRTPPFPAEMPKVALKVGLDLQPVNVSNPDSILWLRSLIWPEHHERVIRLQRALEIARQQRPLLMAGDALKLLPIIISNVPSDTTLCIFHSFTVNQFSLEQRQQLSSILIEASRQREVFRIAYESLSEAEDPVLELYLYLQNLETKQALARASAHGNWMEWLA